MYNTEYFEFIPDPYINKELYLYVGITEIKNNVLYVHPALELKHVQMNNQLKDCKQESYLINFMLESNYDFIVFKGKKFFYLKIPIGNNQQIKNSIDADFKNFEFETDKKQIYTESLIKTIHSVICDNIHYIYFDFENNTCEDITNVLCKQFKLDIDTVLKVI